MKKIVVVALALAVALLGGCEDTDKKNARETERLQKEADRQAGLPNIVNFQEKKLAKAIYELRDQEDLVTYVYTQGMDGKLVFLCKALGFGLPYAAQYTNPMKPGTTTHQAEPNGLFMPSSADATWIMAIDPATGKTHPIYVEPRVIVSPFPLVKN